MSARKRMSLRAIARMKRENRELTGQLAVATQRVEAMEWMPEILDMIRERLVAYHGEEHMKGCPPMFYDDAITNVAHKAAFGKLPREMYPEGSLLHRAETAEAALAAREVRP